MLAIYCCGSFSLFDPLQGAAVTKSPEDKLNSWTSDQFSFTLFFYVTVNIAYLDLTSSLIRQNES